MSTIAINLLRWSTGWDEVHRCIEAVLSSSYSDFHLTYMENPHASASSLVEQVNLHFGSDPRLRIVRNPTNLGYAGAHNQFIAASREPLLMVLNPDAIIDTLFLENIVNAFADPAVAAATGKMVKPRAPDTHDQVLDGTGIQLMRSRRGRERGQLEMDRGQFDRALNVFGVSGTAAVYRNSALQSIRIGASEYFDTDFFAYWEDLDLSWRLQLRGFKCRYVPHAIVEHQRAIGSSEGGARHLKTLIAHRRSFPRMVRQWSWRNHLFCIVKNDFGRPLYRDLPRILAREAGMFLFILAFTPDVLLGLPAFFRLLPRMLRKRRTIQSARVIDSTAAMGLFN